MSEIWNLNSICRCCHADGELRSLQEEYLVDDVVEIYSDMIRHTFGINIEPPEIAASYMICVSCISQIRDAYQFRELIIACEKKFKEYCKNELCYQAEVKVELNYEDDTYQSDDSVGVTYETNAGELIYKQEVKMESPIVQEDLDATETSPSDNNISTEIESVVDHNKKAITVAVPKKNIKKKPKSVTKMPYQCDICLRGFPNNVSLMRHNTFYKHGEIACQVCSVTCESNKHYYTHLKTHKGSFKCKYCSRTSKNAHAHTEHENRHNFKPFTCDICQKSFSFKRSLQTHIMRHYGAHKQKICEICGRGFVDASNLRLHVDAVHKKIRLFKCEVCGKRFVRERGLKFHQQVHKADYKTGYCRRGNFSCHLCDKRFVEAKRLELHILRHDNKWRCRTCNTVFEGRNEYLLHLKDHPVCGANVSAKRKYACSNQSILCTICNKLLYNKYTYNRHMLLHKGGEKKHKCLHCSGSFAEKATLDRHIRRKHMEVLKVPCPVCNKMFINIENHMLCHQDKPYKCDICLRTYTCSRGLTRHMKETHYAPGKYKCELCDKEYKLPKNLKLHKIKKHGRGLAQEKNNRRRPDIPDIDSQNLNDSEPTLIDQFKIN